MFTEWRTVDNYNSQSNGRSYIL